LLLKAIEKTLGKVLDGSVIGLHDWTAKQYENVVYKAADRRWVDHLMPLHLIEDACAILLLILACDPGRQQRLADAAQTN